MRRPEVGIFALAMLASACAIPTESPNWDMTWNLPVPDKGKLSIGVASFLPNGVTAVGNPPTAFTAAITAPAPISRTLGCRLPELCATQRDERRRSRPSPAPPATTSNFTAGANLTSGTLTTGSQIVFTINNGYNFDPIRPQAGSATTNTGTLTLTVNNGAATLGVLTILGTANSIPANAISTFTLPLSGTINGSQPLSVTMTMTSPAGSPVTINTAQVFSISSVPTISISSATVSILAQPIVSRPDTVDMSNIDSTIVKRVKDTTGTEGTMFLTITNPFTVGGATVINFSSPPGTPATNDHADQQERDADGGGEWNDAERVDRGTQLQRQGAAQDSRSKPADRLRWKHRRRFADGGTGPKGQRHLATAAQLQHQGAITCALFM